MLLVIYIKPSLLKILKAIFVQETILRTELQERVGYPANSFRARLSELAQMGLIEKTKTHITITDKGKKAVMREQKCIVVDSNNGLILKDVATEGHNPLLIEEEGEIIKITIVISDLHFGDENVMIETYKSAVNNLINKLKDLATREEIGKITVILNGDIVAGRGIFRGQEAQNIFNKGNIQVLYAAALILELDRALRDIAPITYYVIKGNHDHHTGDNYAWELADKLRAFLLDAYYAGHQLILNLGDKQREHWALIEHGYGGSDYYPISYDFLRNTWKKLNWINREQREKGRKEIERVVAGHTHWLVTNIRQDPYWSIDVSGGFQRNNRVELGKNQRPAGFILYVFNPKRTGLTVYDWKEGLRLYEITPDENIMLRELADPALEMKNRANAPHKLMELYNYLLNKGLIRREG